MKYVNSLIVLILVLVSANAYSQNRIAFVEDDNGEIYFQYKHSFSDNQVDRLLECFPNVLAMKEGDIAMFDRDELIGFYKNPNFSTRRIEEENILMGWGFELLIQKVPTIYTRDRNGLISGEVGQIDLEAPDIEIGWAVLILLLITVCYGIYGLLKIKKFLKEEVSLSGGYPMLINDTVIEKGKFNSYYSFLGNFTKTTIVLFIIQLVSIAVLSLIWYWIFGFIFSFNEIVILILSILTAFSIYIGLSINSGNADWEFNYVVFPFSITAVYAAAISFHHSGFLTWDILTPVWILLFCGVIIAVIGYHLFAVTLMKDG